VGRGVNVTNVPGHAKPRVMGYFTIARWRGIPIKIHITAPLGAIVWTGGSPSLVRIAAFILMIVLHELGHAVLMRRYRMRVLQITVHAMGGECWGQGHVTPTQDAVVSWGGVWAQGLLALAVWGWTLMVPPSTKMAFDLVDMFTHYNLYNAAFNLLPVPPLDGSKAWKLIPLLWKRQGRIEGARDARHEMKQIQKQLKQVLAEAARKANENSRKSKVN
jgi:Zn-dependent protease